MPKKNVDRDALTRIFSNIKPRFTSSASKRLRRFNQRRIALSLTGLTVLLLFASSPVLSIPLLKHSVVLAQDVINPTFSLPFEGYISTKFSSYHPGIDIATNLGTPIHPLASGIVEDVLFESVGYGHHVIISHPDGYKTLYGHMDQIFVIKGQAVSTFTILGTVGLTGRTTGPHTHLELSKDGKNIDPLAFLPPLSDIPNAKFLGGTGGVGSYIAPVPTPTPTPQPKLAKILKPDFY